MSGSKFGLGYIRSILKRVISESANFILNLLTYLVSLMSSSSGNLALLARCELSQIPMIVTLPVTRLILTYVHTRSRYLHFA